MILAQVLSDPSIGQGDNLRKDAPNWGCTRFTRADYTAIGGVIGSLNKRAADIYDNFDPETQATMRHVMLRMVAVEGSELARRCVPKLELEHPTKDRYIPNN